MPTSTSDRAFVWIWLPGEREPVPAGLLRVRGVDLTFQYGTRYLERPNRMSVYGPELPLTRQAFQATADLHMPGAIRDASPDAWGRRVIMSRLTGDRGRDVETDRLPELTYLLESGSNRFGALDFQASATEYVARTDAATLDELHDAADRVEAGEPLPPELGEALLSGTAIGGARPKALIEDGGDQYIAKFSVATDPFPVVNAEAACMQLARRAGIEVSEFEVVRSLGRDVLLMKRFDRGPGATRRMAVSGLTMLGLGEMTSRYGTYPDLYDVLMAHSAAPEHVGEQLFRRIAFNIAISNTDDHLRNHAAFWNGEHLDLTPAYDLSPMVRSGETARQILAFGRAGERDSRFHDLVRVSSVYGMSRPAGQGIVDEVVEAIMDGWNEAADIARLTQVDRQRLWQRQILNPAVFHRS